ncbi:MAG: NUDIX domain-containing protein [Polyangiaceae bacterium]|nr:NUDIX domain-containing protein [Polyangiaceae bacterium]
MLSEARKEIRVVTAVLESEGRYLITQRRAEATLPLLWEFPGGRVETGESDQQAHEREVRHRLGVAIDVHELISFIHHSYERYSVELYLYSCRLRGLERPVNAAVHDHRWVKSDEFEKHNFTPADELSLIRLLGLE